MASAFQFALLLCLTSGLLAAASCCKETKATSDASSCPGRCPSGWTQYGSRCFMFYLSGRSWIEAERYCLSVGGNLASVHKASEHFFLRNYITRVSGASRITWIGGHDAVKEGTWLWSDGSQFNYKRWYVREPNNLRAEHCLEMNFAGNYWNDKSCITVRPFICSRDM